MRTQNGIGVKRAMFFIKDFLSMISYNRLNPKFNFHYLQETARVAKVMEVVTVPLT